jgi:outer membrane protein assembly factor BamB
VAKGTLFRRINLTLGLIGVVAIFVTYGVITGWNPLPGWANWVENVTIRKLSTPATTWTARSGNEPDAAAVLPTAIVVASDGNVESYDPVTGIRYWSLPDVWAGVAGDKEPVVVVGRQTADGVKDGFDAYDPISGAKLWGIDEKAGVWTYSDRILILHCPSGDGCTLRSIDPQSEKQDWSIPINAPGRPLTGFQPSLVAVTPVASVYAKSLAAMPVPTPALIGLRMGDQIHVIDTVHGKALHVFTPDKTQRIVVTPDIVLSDTATLRGNSCYYQESGLDPATGRQIWHENGYNLGTSSGLGCDQRHDESGGGDMILGTNTAGRDLVLDASTGHLRYTAPAGEHVVAMDATLAVLSSTDGDEIHAIDLGTGKQLWSQASHRDATVGVMPDYVVSADPTDAGKITAYGRRTGDALLTVVSGSTVLGAGPSSLIINIGRTLGPLPVLPGS